MGITKLSFAQSLEITLFAMVLVFLLLVFIALVIKLQSKIVGNFTDKKKKNNSNIETVKAEELEKTHEEVEEIDKDSEYETVAAIMAALSSYIDVPIDKLNIKSIKRINNNAWGQTSLRNSLK